MRAGDQSVHLLCIKEINPNDILKYYSYTKISLNDSVNQGTSWLIVTDVDALDLKRPIFAVIYFRNQNKFFTVYSRI